MLKKIWVLLVVFALQAVVCNINVLAQSKKAEEEKSIWEKTEQMYELQDTRKILHILITIPSVISLLAILWKYHFNIRKLLPKNKEPDIALLLISLGLITWAFIGYYNLTNKPEDNRNIELFLSYINNTFFICSFTFFEYGFGFLKKIESKYTWYLGTMVGMLLFYLVSIGIGETDNMNMLISICTLIGFAVLLYKSFSNRELKLVGITSALVFIVHIYAQISLEKPDLKIFEKEIFENNYDEYLYIASFAGICIFFVALGLTWISEKINEITPITILNVDEKIKESKVEENLFLKIEDEIRKDNLKKGIPKLLAILNVIKHEDKNKFKVDLSFLSTRIYKINLQSIMGVIPKKNYIAERQKITNSLLKLVEEIKISTNY